MKILKTAVTVICICVISAWFLAGFSYAEIPRIINYQGKLTDPSGKPVSDGTYSITFRIYDRESGGSPLWYETQSIATQKGIFSTQIGATKDLNLPFDKPYYLGIQVGSDAEMTPRQRLTSSGYAFRAETAEMAARAEESSTALLAQDSNKLNNKDPSFYLDRSSHTGSIEFDDLSPSLQDILSSGSKTIGGLSKNVYTGTYNWYDIYNGSFHLVLDKTVTVNFSMDTELWSGYHAKATFELYISGTHVAETWVDAGSNVFLTGNKSCEAGEVTVRVRVRTMNAILKNGIVNINW